MLENNEEKFDKNKDPQKPVPPPITIIKENFSLNDGKKKNIK